MWLMMWFAPFLGFSCRSSFRFPGVDCLEKCVAGIYLFHCTSPIDAMLIWISQTVPATSVGRKISQRNCQTWIIESAEQLVKDNILSREVADYLRAIEQ